MSRSFSLSIVVAFVVVGGPQQAFGEATRCAVSTVLAPDGRTLNGQIPATTGFWFSFLGVAGRSYSIEVTSRGTERGVTPGGVTLLKACGEEVPARNTSGLEPPINLLGTRLSFVAPSTGSFTFQVLNTRDASVPYAVAVSETTLFCTFVESDGSIFRYVNFFLTNTTRSDVDVTFTLDPVLNSQPAISWTDRVPGAGVWRASTINRLASETQLGQHTTLAHNGPPGAILADALWTSTCGETSCFQQPTTCAPVRDKR